MEHLLARSLGCRDKDTTIRRQYSEKDFLSFVDNNPQLSFLGTFIYADNTGMNLGAAVEVEEHQHRIEEAVASPAEPTEFQDKVVVAVVAAAAEVAVRSHTQALLVVRILSAEGVGEEDSSRQHRHCLSRT